MTEQSKEPRRCWVILTAADPHTIWVEASEDAIDDIHLEEGEEVVPMVEASALEAAQARIKELEAIERDLRMECDGAWQLEAKETKRAEIAEEAAERLRHDLTSASNRIMELEAVCSELERERDRFHHDLDWIAYCALGPGNWTREQVVKKLKSMEGSFAALAAVKRWHETDGSVGGLSTVIDEVDAALGREGE